MILSGDREIWKWGCSGCRGPDFADQDNKRWARNCDMVPNSPTRVVRDWAPGLKHCPWAELGDERVWECVTLWRNWSDYQVPTTAQLRKGPAWLWQAVTACDAARRSCEFERQQEMQRKKGGT